MKKQIIIKVEGGLIVDVSSIPSGVVVKVADFDIDGCPDEKMDTVDGELARVSYWGLHDKEVLR